MKEKRKIPASETIRAVFEQKRTLSPSKEVKKQRVSKDYSEKQLKARNYGSALRYSLGSYQLLRTQIYNNGDANRDYLIKSIDHVIYMLLLELKNKARKDGFKLKKDPLDHVNRQY